MSTSSTSQSASQTIGVPMNPVPMRQPPWRTSSATPAPGRTPGAFPRRPRSGCQRIGGLVVRRHPAVAADVAPNERRSRRARDRPVVRRIARRTEHVGVRATRSRLWQNQALAIRSGAVRPPGSPAGAGSSQSPIWNVPSKCRSWPASAIQSTHRRMLQYWLRSTPSRRSARQRPPARPPLRRPIGTVAAAAGIATADGARRLAVSSRPRRSRPRGDVPAGLVAQARNRTGHPCRGTVPYRRAPMRAAVDRMSPCRVSRRARPSFA